MIVFDASAVVSAALREDGVPERALLRAEKTELFALSVSLGGVESLLCYSSEMTHASVAGTELAVPDDLLRLSVGIEDAEDLVADEQLRARRMLQRFDVSTGEEVIPGVDFPGVTPVLGDGPVEIDHLGPDLGEHTDEVLAWLEAERAGDTMAEVTR